MTGDVDQSVAGDNDTWMLFDRFTPDGYPLVVRTRTGNQFVENALRSGLVTVVDCVPEIEFVNDGGMPTQMNDLYDIEDSLIADIESMAASAFHVASITGDGRRRIVFAHAAPIRFDNLLAPLSVRGLSLKASDAEDRQALIELVTPTDIERQLNGDLGVISNLEKHDDDGLVPRKTDFWFYGEKEQLEGLVAELADWGYAVEHWLDEPDGVVVTSVTQVDFETFREVTPALVAIAERHNVTYDGWETMALGSAASRPEPPAETKPKSLLGRLFGAKNN